MTNNNQAAPVTDEELDQMIWKLERDGMTPKQLSLMRELREVRRAKGEPVAWMYDGEDGREYNGHNEFSGGGKGVPLYAAPSAPVVPTNVADAIERLKQRLADCHRFNYCAEAVREVEDACRAAMLQSPGNSEQLEPVSNRDELNSPATPDGWVMVPVEPTKEMIDAGWLHFMGAKNPSSKGTYKAMLEAAPKEVG